MKLLLWKRDGLELKEFKNLQNYEEDEKNC